MPTDCNSRRSPRACGLRSRRPSRSSILFVELLLASDNIVSFVQHSHFEQQNALHRERAWSQSSRSRPSDAHARARIQCSEKILSDAPADTAWADVTSIFTSAIPSTSVLALVQPSVTQAFPSVQEVGISS